MRQGQNVDGREEEEEEKKERGDEEGWQDRELATCGGAEQEEREEERGGGGEEEQEVCSRDPLWQERRAEVGEGEKRILGRGRGRGGWARFVQDRARFFFLAIDEY